MPGYVLAVRLPVSAYVLAIVAVVVSPCIVVTSTMLFVGGISSGEPLSRADTIMAALASGLALIIVVIAVVAHRRKTSDTRFGLAAARFAPLLLGLGIIAGVGLGLALTDAQRDAAWSIDAGLCTRFETLGTIDTAACVAVARTCRHETRDGSGLRMPQARGASAPAPPPMFTALRMDEMVSDQRRAQAACMAERRDRFAQ